MAEIQKTKQVCTTGYKSKINSISSTQTTKLKLFKSMHPRFRSLFIILGSGKLPPPEDSA